MRRAAVLLTIGLLATASGAGGAPAQAGSVPACTAAAVHAIEHHVTLTTLPAGCRGLSRAQLNLALGRAIFEVAGAGQHKGAWRRRAAAVAARLSRLIQSQPPHQPPGRSPAGHPAPPPAPANRWGTGLGTLAAWLLTMGIGAFMLVPWIRRGGLRPRAGRSRLGPAVTLGHFTAASAGLLIWIAYLVTGSAVLGWLAVGILLAVIGLGMATLTVWTAQGARPAEPGPPSPAPVPAAPIPAAPAPAPARPAPADAASAPAGPAPPGRGRSDRRIIFPIVHGLTASATILLALLTVLGAG